jgi:hypothetical protein
MYIFVFLWTPVLDTGSTPLGMVFSCFMVSTASEHIYQEEIIVPSTTASLCQFLGLHHGWIQRVLAAVQ